MKQMSWTTIDVIIRNGLTLCYHLNYHIPWFWHKKACIH